MPNLSAHKTIALQNVFDVKGNVIEEISIGEGKIKSINEHPSNNKKNFQFYFNNAIAFPGLINSHDHLDFDLFPRLGNKIYEDYIEWGRDIHEKNKETINNVLKVPKALRIQWGIYKNLLAGVTTVVHHGEYIQTKNDLLNIYQQSNVLHSAQLEKKLKLKLNNPFAKPFPFVIHVGEGTNEQSHAEINELIKWNLFKRELIGVHGIAMTEEQAKYFKAIIWCPDSNLFLQNKTAAVDKLKKYTTILFGTDSTVSADWNIWSQLRLARKTNLLNDKELYKSITESGSLIWNLNAGSLEKNKDADIVVAKSKSSFNYFDNFFSLKPEDILLILYKGEVVLFDESLVTQFTEDEFLKLFSKIFINNNCKYVKGDLPALIKVIKQYNPDSNFPFEIE
ncbi:MAG TPA: amidohydrolase family protein [Parafilimonas sp.]